MNQESPHLARRIGLPLICFYGLGTILGAGIYVLVGKVAGEAGMLSPLAFFLAALIAGVTALSYAQLVSAFPQSAGEAVYIYEAFEISWLSALAGWLVVITGVVSSATIVIGFAGYLGVFVELPDELVMILLVFLLAIVAAWGIAESLWVAAAMTLLEIFGLLLVLYFTRHVWVDVPHQFTSYVKPSGYIEWTGVLSGSFLAFYAFIGFEDMVNVAEEVKEPEVNMPKAILIALCVSTVLYMLIAFVSVSVMSIEELQASEAPLSDLLHKSSPWAGKVIAVISLFAVLNGALIQMVMGSRVLYGMANVAMAPRFFSRVNAFTRTPLIATATLALVMLFFALFVPLVSLAKITSFVVLCIFTLVNLSLWKLHRSNDETLRLGVEPGEERAMKMPVFPVTGALLSFSLLVFQVYQEVVVIGDLF